MTKDERIDNLKNKISMALKDPILQLGFEIICKNLSEPEEACDEIQELLDKQIEATYKVVEENKELKTVKIPQLERRIASIRGCHSVDAKKLNARIEQVERLKQENAELKDKYDKCLRENTGLKIHNTYVEKKLSEAKELLREFVEWANWQGNSKCPSFKNIQDKAEAFLKG